jgi:cell division protein FtsZ
MFQNPNDKATININDEKEITLNPLNSSIADGLSRRTEERKIKLKEFNYNFNKAKNLINMENEPAFKRAGINFDDVEKIKDSSNSFVKDSNGEINLQIDKSFLHDNVD